MDPSRTHRQYSRQVSGFSLVEILTVLAVVAIMVGLLAGPLSNLRSTSLSTAAREFADFVKLCRSEAIARHTAVRVAIATGVTGEGEALAYRQYSAWIWDKRSRRFEPFTEWRTLPRDLTFDPASPRYTRDAEYVRTDPAASRGDYVLAASDNHFEWQQRATGRDYTLQYFEFSPAGRASLPDGDLRKLILIVRPGDAGAPPSRPANWAQFNIDTLTGRLRIYRP